MASRALTTWRMERSERLDELLHAHQSVGGPSRGRRWRTATLNEALLLRLAAEFQGFARDLHEQTCDTFAAWITPSDPTVQQTQTIQGAELLTALYCLSDTRCVAADSLGDVFLGTS